MSSRTLSAPNTFEGFADLHARKRSNWTGKVGPNTYARHLPRRLDALPDDARDAYALQYHQTDVVTLYRDGRYEFDTGGWDTSTTVERMNESCPAGWYVAREGGEILIGRRGDSPESWKRAVRYLPGRRWTMTPDCSADGFRVTGDGLERLTDIVLRRIGGSVFAIERDEPTGFRCVLTGETMDPTAGKGVRSSSPDARAVLRACTDIDVRTRIRRTL